ncbi:MAG: hypothetical protein ABSG83_01515 [Roseiarcus sp.]|jgi:hypothetical protein
MHFKSTFIAIAAFGALAAPPAHAIGCASGAVAGGVAGHMLHHHAVLGAIGGCIYGHHERKVEERRRQEGSDRPAMQDPQKTY